MNPLSSSSTSEWINIDFPIDGKQLWLDGLTCSKVRPCSRLTALCRPLQALPHRKTTDPRGLRVGEMVRDLLLTTWRPWSLPVGGKDFLNSRSGGYWATLSAFFVFCLFFPKSLSELLTPPLSLRWGCPTLGIVGNLAYVCFCCTTTLASTLYKGRWKGGRDTRHQRY